MTPYYLNRWIIPPALALLEARHDTPEARAMLIAIALQESGLKARRQSGNGPARSFWQFEKGGIEGVLNHKASRETIRKVCVALDVEPAVDAIHAAIEYNDILGAACARLLLFTSPNPMPKSDEMMPAWEMYCNELWRPGKPRFDSWEQNWSTAWGALK